MAPIEFGDKVVVTEVYQRRGAASSGRSPKYWERKSIQRRKGLYIGTRTLANGVTEWVGSEEGYCFFPREHFKAALVVFSERERPVLVPIDNIRDLYGYDWDGNAGA